MEYKIIKECIQIDYDFNYIAELLNQNPSIHKLKNLAYAHGVLPTVYNILKENVSEDNFFEILNLFKTANKEISLKNFFMTGQLIFIIKKFSDNSINCIPIKGPILSLEIYDNTFMRQFSDLDILVGKDQFIQAANILEALDFKCTEDLNRIKYVAIHSTQQDFSFIHKDTGIVVELHWVLDKNHKGVLADLPYLFQTARASTYHGVQVQSLDFDLQLFYLCIHGSKHRWERLEWICDIDRLIRKNDNIQWEKTLSMAKEASMYTMYILGLAAAHYYCKTPLSNQTVKEAIKKKNIQKLLASVISLQEENYFLLTKPKGIRWKEIIFKLRAQDRFIDKIQSLFYFFFPLYRDDIGELPSPDKVSLWQLPFYRIRRKLKH